jgi:hypothetical protein
LVKHGSIILENVPRDYEGIKKYLEKHYIEGIVFYRGNGEMCKIKRSDFGFEWNKKRNNKEKIESKLSTLTSTRRNINGNTNEKWRNENK